MQIPDLFKSNVAGWAICGTIAIGGVLIALDQFRVADITWLLGAIWSLMWLWYQPYRGTLFDIAIIGIVVAIFIILFHYTEEYRINRILAENHGLLQPANDWVPPLCGNLNSDYRILDIVGSPIAVESFPITVLQIKDAKLLSLDVIDGLLAITLHVFSQDGKIIATIDHNQFTVNHNNILKKEHPDLSTLLVYDQYNKKVLDIRYMNSTTIRLRAMLKYDSREVDLTDDGLFVDGLPRSSNICYVMSGKIKHTKPAILVN